MDVVCLSCINMNYTHIQNQPYCGVQVCIKSIGSFWHSVLFLIWHKNSHSYGRNGLFFPSLFHLSLAISETEVARRPRTVVLNLSCTGESAWEPSKILMPGSHPRESRLISGNAGYTGRMWRCTEGWEPQAWGLISPSGSQPGLQVRITWKAVAKKNYCPTNQNHILWGIQDPGFLGSSQMISDALQGLRSTDTI